MKKYEDPKIEVIVFATDDIITTSGDLTPPGGLTPPIPGEDEGGIF